MNRDWEHAVRKNEPKQVRDLLRDSGNLNSKDRYGQTALMVAAKEGNAAIARILIEAGAELNVTAKFHLSALMLAVLNRHVEIVSLLVEAGADREIRGSGAPGFENQTALDLADQAGYIEIAPLLR